MSSEKNSKPSTKGGNVSEVREFNLTVRGGATNSPEQWYWEVHQKPTQYHDDLIAVDKDDHDRIVAEMQKRIDELSPVHTCHDKCRYKGCVQRRRIEKLEAALKFYADIGTYGTALPGEAVSVDASDCEPVLIDGWGESYRPGKRAREAIKGDE